MFSKTKQNKKLKNLKDTFYDTLYCQEILQEVCYKICYFSKKLIIFLTHQILSKDTLSKMVTRNDLQKHVECKDCKTLADVSTHPGTLALLCCIFLESYCKSRVRKSKNDQRKWLKE